MTSLPDTHFKKLVIKMLTEIRKSIRVNAHRFNKELENIKTTQSKEDNSISEIKKKHFRSNKKLNKRHRECIRNLEGRIMEIIQSEQIGKQILKSNIRELQDSIFVPTYT